VKIAPEVGLILTIMTSFHNLASRFAYKAGAYPTITLSAPYQCFLQRDQDKRVVRVSRVRDEGVDPFFNLIKIDRQAYLVTVDRDVPAMGEAAEQQDD
jgi:hypothetical protein